MLEILDILRLNLRDPECRVWSDDELNRLILRALEAYSRDTGIFRGDFPILVNAYGHGTFPDDFLSFLCGWNGEGQIDKGTLYLKSCLKSAEGLPTLLFDGGEYGYNAAPNPYALESREDYVCDGYGEIQDGDAYGVVTGGYGVCQTAVQFNNVGMAHYTRLASLSEVTDQSAIVFHAAYQAFMTDTDLKNVDMAVMYLSFYKMRVNALTRVRSSMGGVRRPANFF